MGTTKIRYEIKTPAIADAIVMRAVSAAIDAAIASVRADGETVCLFPAAFFGADAESVRAYNAASDAAETALDVLRDEIAALHRSISRSLDLRSAHLAAKSAIRCALSNGDIPSGTRAFIGLSEAAK